MNCVNLYTDMIPGKLVKLSHLSKNFCFILLREKKSIIKLLINIQKGLNFSAT